MKKKLSYAASGVSIDRGNELVRRIQQLTRRLPRGASAIGGFSGLYAVPGVKDLFLSGCTDGVGTKLRLAFITGTHNTVGIDLVAMNVNDLICTGARPLFFLDYFACGKLNVQLAESVLSGIVEGCAQANCALLGGETAEMPGFYPEGEYDLAGFAVGIAEKKNLLTPQKIKAGDVVLGLPSSGPHSNGYSLIRKVFGTAELKKRKKELLAPTQIYVRPVLDFFKKYPGVIKGLAHITGGGWIENPTRALPKNLGIRFQMGSWPILPVFETIQKRGNIDTQEMFRTFNMGIGLMLVVSKEKAALLKKYFKAVYLIGEVTTQKGVSFS